MGTDGQIHSKGHDEDKDIFRNFARRLTTAYCPQYSNVFRSDSYKKQVLFPYTALTALSNDRTLCSLRGIKLTLSYVVDNFDHDRLESKKVLVTARSKIT